MAIIAGSTDRFNYCNPGKFSLNCSSNQECSLCATSNRASSKIIPLRFKGFKSSKQFNFSAMILALSLITAGIIFVCFVHRHFNYWQRHGFIQKNLTLAQKFRKIASFKFPSLLEYNQLKKNGVFGFYYSLSPVVMITDPLIIRDILIRNHQYFYNRKTEVDESIDPVGASLFSMHDDDWKEIRALLSPAFAASKLRHNVQLFEGVCDNLEAFISRVGQTDTHDLMTRVMTDIIALWTFTVKVDSINDPSMTNEFYEATMQFFSTDWKASFKNLCLSFMPSLLKILKIKFIGGEIEPFFRNLVEEIDKHREKENYSQKDFMQLLIKLKSSMRSFGYDQMTGHSVSIFLASMETFASLLTFGLFEIARNVEVQRKCQSEIDEILAQPDGSVYDRLMQMKYLDCCISETLRKYPVASSVNRVCSKDYRIPSKGLTIPKGTMVYISSFRLHRDSEIFQSPMQFLPERFNNSPKGCDVAGISYFPFGSGHRNCVGQNLVNIVTKMIFSRLLHKFDLEIVGNETKEIHFVKQQIVLTPSDKIVIRFHKRNE